MTANHTDSNQNIGLAKATSDTLCLPIPGKWTVGSLERALLDRFPADHALEWDRTGLLVGDPAEPVKGVAIALDPTVETIRLASALGANVLLTHHPAFLDPPAMIRPSGPGAFGPGTVVWEAVRTGVALIDFHTTLDVSPAAASVLPGMLGLEFQSIVDISVPEEGLGFGQLCLTPDDEPLTLKTLSARCLAVFGRAPRVWGDMDSTIRSVVTCTGSQGGLAEHCLSLGIDCLICGEVRYHDALDASQAGLCLIELGHDVSEIPLTAVLAAALEDAGFPHEGYRVIESKPRWTTPEAIRK